jgi:hypothetical protein
MPQKQNKPVKAYQHKSSRLYVNTLGELIDNADELPFETLMAIWRVLAGTTAFVILVYIILKTT